MRPKSALFYINDMDELMEDFVVKLEGNLFRRFWPGVKSFNRLGEGEGIFKIIYCNLENL